MDTARDAKDNTTTSTLASLQQKLNEFIELDNAREAQDGETDASHAELVALEKRLEYFIGGEERVSAASNAALAALASKVDTFIEMDNARDAAKEQAIEAATESGNMQIDLLSQIDSAVKSFKDEMTTDDGQHDALALKVQQLERTVAGYRDFEHLAIAGVVFGTIGFVMGLAGLGLACFSARFAAPRTSTRHVELEGDQAGPPPLPSSLVSRARTPSLWAVHTTYKQRADYKL